MRNVFCCIIFTTLAVMLSSCAGKNHNAISNKKMNSVREGSKALVLMQVSPIIAKRGNPYHLTKGIETEWINLSDLKSTLHTKNYQPVYIIPEMTSYKYHNIELYLVSPGEYVLNKFKYIENDTLSHTLSYIKNKATFSIKGGEVLYLGHFIFNIKDYGINADNFFTSTTRIKDDFSVAKDYINLKYPDLSVKLQKKLITLQKNNW